VGIAILLNTQKEIAMLIQEVVAIKPQLPKTAAQARIAVLKKGVDRAQVAVKAERKRQQVLAAQQRLQKAAATSLKH
jgi:hypothetical protein